MDTADLTFNTNGNFVQSFVLTSWADLYDLTSGVFYSQMRLHANENVVLYEWSTANGRINYSQTRATGSITFTLNPTALDHILLGSTLVTFVTSGAVGNQVNIGATLPLTMANLLSFLTASTDPQIMQCSYSIASSQVLQVVYNTPGTLGNAFAIDAIGGGSTVSNLLKTLQSGGAAITLIAPVEDIEEFLGDYVYDVRFQIELTNFYVPIVGGIMTFVQGVTRDTAV
jgi:hypothetical protein